MQKKECAVVLLAAVLIGACGHDSIQEPSSLEMLRVPTAQVALEPAQPIPIPTPRPLNCGDFLPRPQIVGYLTAEYRGNSFVAVTYVINAQVVRYPAPFPNVISPNGGYFTPSLPITGPVPTNGSLTVEVTYHVPYGQADLGCEETRTWSVVVESF